MVDELAAALRRGALAARYDALRRERAQPYEPWPFDGPRSTVARELLADALQAGGADAAPRARLAGLGVLDGDVPAVWSVTGHRGVLAAQDAAHVYIGSDSLRFADHVQNECATGTGLDVGCGSGISTCRLAATCTEVYAVDVVSEAVAATRVAAELNGCADRVHARHLSLMDLADDPEFAGRRFQTVIANLPGVPVPPEARYSPAGDGGPDGLALIRRLLAMAPRLLDLENGTLLMRFQSLGTVGGRLMLEPDLRELSHRYRWDASVVAETRVPVAVRAAVTTRYAAPLQPEQPVPELLGRVEEHLAGTGCDSYFSCSLALHTNGRGRFSYVDTTGPSLAGLTWRRSAGSAGEPSLVTARFLESCRDLPDEYWEIADGTALEDIARGVPAILAALSRPADAAQLADALDLESGPIQQRAVELALDRLIWTLRRQGLVTVA